MTPNWARWRPSEPFSIGIEEEVMMLRPDDWSLAQEIDAVLPSVAPDLADHLTAETHGAAVELATDPHDSVGAAIDQLARLRSSLEEALEAHGLRAAPHAPVGGASARRARRRPSLEGPRGAQGRRAAPAGTPPSTVWHETVVSSGSRYQFVYGSMRELARREPTFALHVHVGVRE